MRILYLTASAQFAAAAQAGADAGIGQEYAELDLWLELKRVTEVLFDSRNEGRVHFEVVPEVMRSDVSRYLGEQKIDVLHFSGHGEKDRPLDGVTENELIQMDREHQIILMDDEHEGMFGRYVMNDWLRDQLSGRGIKILVLNCCWSAGVAEKLRGVADCIIGTTIPLRQDLAAEFSAQFYQGLEKGLTLRELKTLFDKDNRMKDLYHFEVANEAVWDQVIHQIPMAERDMTPARRALSKRAEIVQMQRQVKGRVRIEGVKVALAIAVAVLGWLVIDLFLADLLPERFKYLANILRWEPAAVMTAIAGNPVGRLAAAGLIALGSHTAINMLQALSMKPPGEIELELETGRVAAMIEWLRDWMDSPELTTAAPQA